MQDQITKNIISQTFLGIFGRETTLTKQDILEKLAFDVKIPALVNDTTTGEETWAASINPTKYITQKNSEARDSWLLEKRQFSSLDDLLAIWKEINFTTTERNYNCVNVFESDTVYGSENVIRSTDCNACKNIMFCDSTHHSNYCIACQRSGDSEFCLRVDDSANCTNSYNVICSGKISNSFFIQDCNSLHECIFCSHIESRRYCIANMQFEKDEYFALKDQITSWILANL
ncbi:hypothetical protein IKE83_00805 [Candidatus Saccharibacteria bacterium]|nr:hypothetical protein [Candidatus Saccharibacteria bacterium]